MHLQFFLIFPTISRENCKNNSSGFCCFFFSSLYMQVMCMIKIEMHYAISFLQQVLKFFSYLINILGNNVVLIVKPTFHDGLSVGVSWKLGMLSILLLKPWYCLSSETSLRDSIKFLLWWFMYRMEQSTFPSRKGFQLPYTASVPWEGVHKVQQIFCLSFIYLYSF